MITSSLHPGTSRSNHPKGDAIRASDRNNILFLPSESALANILAGGQEDNRVTDRLSRHGLNNLAKSLAKFFDERMVKR